MSAQTSLFPEISQADRLKQAGIKMDWYKKKTGDIPLSTTPLRMEGLTPRQWHAVKHMADKGLTPQMSIPPNIQFLQRDTKEVVTFTLDELLAEWDDDRKENARAKKAEQRLNVNVRRIVV